MLAQAEGWWLDANVVIARFIVRPPDSDASEGLTEFIHHFKKKTRPQLSRELFIPKAFGTKLKGFFLLMRPV
jgi:hypothetical protein